jgi:hypothetical protein
MDKVEDGNTKATMIYSEYIFMVLLTLTNFAVEKQMCMYIFDAIHHQLIISLCSSECRCYVYLLTVAAEIPPTMTRGN